MSGGSGYHARQAFQAIPHNLIMSPFETSLSSSFLSYYAIKKHHNYVSLLKNYIRLTLAFGGNFAT